MSNSLLKELSAVTTPSESEESCSSEQHSCSDFRDNTQSLATTAPPTTEVFDNEEHICNDNRGDKYQCLAATTPPTTSDDIEEDTSFNTQDDKDPYALPKAYIEGPVYRVKDHWSGEVVTFNCSRAFAAHLNKFKAFTVEKMSDEDDLIGLIVYIVDDDVVVADGDLATIMMQGIKVEGAGKYEETTHTEQDGRNQNGPRLHLIPDSKKQ